jgi:hypothetical protein
MTRVARCALLLLTIAGSALGAVSPPTVNNDDSCDVIVTPAATLLLPYFEVDLTPARTETTLFSVINVAQLPQIARVTLWTDWSFPLLSFNVFLTGYDAQSIDLYDILVAGRLSGPDGTSSDVCPGERSPDNDENPLLEIADCNSIPVQLPPVFSQEIVRVLTTGRSPGWCSNQRIGGEHAHAAGYVTIDVVASCSPSLPTDPGYFTSEILFDNVLTGDYEQVNRAENLARGGPMVHIRAIPEGGPTGAHPTNFTTTFYSNYQNGGTADRRQPLPAIFAARWIDEADSPLETNFTIWREGITRAHSGCAVASNGSLTVADIVRFDEDENPVAIADCENCASPARPLLPSSSRPSTDDSVFPPNAGGATSGWMYLNLNNQGVFPFRPFRVASQNWVTVSMSAEGRYQVEFDTASLGNGCSPSVPSTDSGDGDTMIAPAANTIESFAGGAPSTVNNDDSCDIKVAPAATLLLPYFDVNPSNAQEDTTFFTITNVTPLPQIARVTLWTDRAFPVLSFNIFLTGYDVQSIDLSDVLLRGRIAETGMSGNADVGGRSAGNDANPLIDTTACGNLSDRIPPLIQADVLSALTVGRTRACGNARIGEPHPDGHAIGYATVDVVRNCGSVMPVDAGYFENEILYDNVLIGDYQQVDRANNFAQGNTLVHIRAIPEGGLSGSAQTNFRRTFYSRLQNGGTIDRRQPLPSTFAARWIDGGVGELRTGIKMWRESLTNAAAGCAVSANATMPSPPDIVRFDEEENPTVFSFDCIFGLCITPYWYVPVVRQVDVNNSWYDVPGNPADALAGWMYINLDNEFSGPQLPDEMATQAWVIVSMSAEGRFSVDFDAASLGNGCSPRAYYTDEDGGDPAIGPAPNVNPGAIQNP